MTKLTKILTKYEHEDLFESCDTFQEMIGNLIWFKNNTKLTEEEKRFVEVIIYESNINR